MLRRVGYRERDTGRPDPRGERYCTVPAQRRYFTVRKESHTFLSLLPLPRLKSSYPPPPPLPHLTYLYLLPFFYLLSRAPFPALGVQYRFFYPTVARPRFICASAPTIKSLFSQRQGRALVRSPTAGKRLVPRKSHIGRAVATLRIMSTHAVSLRICWRTTRFFSSRFEPFSHFVITRFPPGTDYGGGIT
ncbi:hypothetical protein B9Z19DRAFT_117085 [Tuber borchii]|uniref:Uncharacterized protein n=1 Tax=Tuber borchii TaxID=42251 RepID=A0A2T6ZRI3_TUBBO|nr:hypothetical protein B9Z19DRAFT_117085 [Tuber borchii]